jgi:hypothetical protein
VKAMVGHLLKMVRKSESCNITFALIILGLSCGGHGWAAAQDGVKVIVVI